jgi:hypothetical protein
MPLRKVLNKQHMQKLLPSGFWHSCINSRKVLEVSVILPHFIAGYAPII